MEKDGVEGPTSIGRVKCSTSLVYIKRDEALHYFLSK